MPNIGVCTLTSGPPRGDPPTPGLQRDHHGGDGLPQSPGPPDRRREGHPRRPDKTYGDRLRFNQADAHLHKTRTLPTEENGVTDLGVRREDPEQQGIRIAVTADRRLDEPVQDSVEARAGNRRQCPAARRSPPSIAVTVRLTFRSDAEHRVEFVKRLHHGEPIAGRDRVVAAVE